MKRKLSVLFAALLCAATVSFAETKTDKLTSTTIGSPKSYTEFKDIKVTSDAVYAGQATTGTGTNAGAIQMRSSNSNSGIVSTTSGGTIKSVTITVKSGTKTINVYGSNTAYTAATDLYKSDSQGTLVGSLSATGTVTVTGSYAYVGVRSADGAIYLTDISFEWGEKQDIPATGITLNKNSLALDKGATEQLTATLTPEGATTEIVWKVDNDWVATVANGLVTAVGVGDATITAEVTPEEGTTYRATCRVYVSAGVAVSGVTLDQESLTLEATKTATLVATVLPENATNKTVSWTTSDDKVATVKDGVVTAVAAGTADITVTTEDGAKTAVCNVTVTNISGMNYSVNLGTAAGYNTWTIDNKSIGTLSSVWSLDATNGWAKASAYYNRKNNAAEAWLISPVLDLSEAEVATMTINHALNYLNGNACPLKIMGTKDGANWVELAISEWPAGTSWTFEDATVELTSVISATTQVAFAYISTTTVAPTWEIKTVAIKGTQAVPATAIALDNTTLSLEQYKRGQLTATLTPTDATTPIVWTTSDAKVATVSATGEVLAVGVGSAKITATVTPAETTSYTATCDVTVTAATPITVTKAVEIAKTVSTNNEIADGGMYVIRGYVTQIAYAYSASSNNMSVWMDDKQGGSTSAFQAYKVIPVSADDQEIAVGDFVEVIADITKYNTTYETAAGGSIQMLSMRGSYTVGTATDCDYATLAEAVKAFDVNMANGLVTGDVEFLIASDLTETVNAGIINTTDYTLTIRPDKDEDRVITYTTAADNAGPSGNLVIGGDMRETNIPFVTTATKNVVIDGAAAGKDDRRLSIVGTTTGGRTVVVYGKAENIVIKNCIIKHTRTSGATYALEVRTEKSTDNAPQNLVVENCYLEVTKTANAQVVYLNGSQRSTVAGNPTNTTIRDCEIVSNLRGMFLYGAKDVTIEGCTFRMAKASGGYLAHGINGVTVFGTVNVKGNKFIENGTVNTVEGDNGLQTITASGGATVWMIENNYFAGYDALGAVTDKAIKLTAIRCGDSCVVRHNTFYMPKLTNAPATAAMSATPVSLLYLAGAKTSLVQNNIFVCNEDVANVSLIRGSLTANTTGNKFYCVEGNGVIVAGAAMCADFAALTTNYPTQAATSKWVNVNFADAATGNLDLTGDSDGDVNLGVDALEAVTTDIYGTTRAAYTYAGAYEGKELTKPGPVTGMDEIEEVANGVQKNVRNGQVLILRDGKTYNMMGQVVE